MHRILAAAVIGVVTAATGPLLAAPAAPAATAAAVTATDGCVTSITDPGTTAPVEICFTLFRPASARTASPVPMVLHSHGWGGSRTRTGIELRSVAVDGPAGKTLFLTVSPISDMSAGFGSRVVGAMRLRDVDVHLPVTTR